MNFKRIHILGAPGSGVTTLGKNLAEALHLPHFDTDDYYWIKQDDGLNYRRKRNPDHRRALLSPDLENNPEWVLTGSFCGWGDIFSPLFDLVIFLEAPGEIRAQRIAKREEKRYGKERITEGGDLFGVYVKFQQWSLEYETRSEGLRSLQSEKKWLDDLKCPIISVEAFATESDVLQEITQRMKGIT